MRIKKSGFLSALSLVALATAALPLQAATPPILTLSDDAGNTVSIDSTQLVTLGGNCNLLNVLNVLNCVQTGVTASSGLVGWIGTIGNFSVYVIGRTKPALPAPQVDLNFQYVKTGAAGGVLTATWSDVGFTGSGPASLNETGSFTSGGGSAIYTAYADNTNVAGGTGITIATTPATAGSASMTGPGPTANPFSLTAKVVLTAQPNSYYLTDYSVLAAPTPPLAITSCPTNTTVQGSAYTSAVTATGGVAPLVFSLVSPSLLPNGLVLAPGGAITGTAGTSGPDTFTVAVTDANSTKVQTTCTITVTPQVQVLPQLTLTKTANVKTAAPFQKVTYSYTVTNTGTAPLTNIVVKDDNGTPTYIGDDFTLAPIASLAAGQSITLTATIIPVVTYGGNTKWGWEDSSHDSWGGSSYTSYTGGFVVCKINSDNSVSMTFRQPTTMTDNSYGRSAGYDWGWAGHNMSDLLANQSAEFTFVDGKGNTALDIAVDYVSASSKFPSGYGTLGVSGGNGKVYKGDGTKILSVDTTLSHNLNQPGYYQYTKDSPSTPTTNWDNNCGYSVKVAGTCFGSNGFGSVKVAQCQNSHSKDRSKDDESLTPVNSTVTNTAVASTTYNGAPVSATAKASVSIVTSTPSTGDCNNDNKAWGGGSDGWGGWGDH